MAAVFTGASSQTDSLRPQEFWAVRDVSFELRRGESLGLIGHNGAGKTTLLRMLNGLIRPDAGKITMRGRVAALIALGAGFNPILTGRENIFANASVLGLSRREIDRKFDGIVDFSGVEEFLDAPVQSYSSGMQVRLGFAVAAAIDPDILIIDEVLAVGDAAFQLKCLSRIGELIGNGCSIIFVSHQMFHVARVCNRGLLLGHGKVLGFGDIGAVIQAYRSVPTVKRLPSRHLAADKAVGARIDKVTVADHDGHAIKQIPTGREVVLSVYYNADQVIDDAVVTISFTSDFDGLQTHYTTLRHRPVRLSGGSGVVRLRIPHLGLAAGEWRIAAGIFDGSGIRPYDWNWSAQSLDVTEANPMIGRFQFAHEWLLPPT